jgi:hypothetical protein
MRPLGNIVTAITRLRLPRECKSVLFRNVLLTRFRKAMGGLGAMRYPTFTESVPVQIGDVPAPARVWRKP